MDTEEQLREQLVACMLELQAHELNRGSSGNASARIGEGILITPSAVQPAALRARDIVRMDPEGVQRQSAGRPSSEWRMHAMIYAERPDAGAIVHCHSRYASALACCHRAIPAFHYMVAIAGGDEIRCAPYATFGSAELARSALVALEGCRACLLANHGQITLGRTVQEALLLAVEIEELAAQYWACLAIGGAKLLDRAEMRRVLDRFADYRRPLNAESTAQTDRDSQDETRA